jgi:hypothetical protein
MRSLVLLAMCPSLAVAVTGCGSGATTNCKVPPDRALLIAVHAHAGPVVLPTLHNPRGTAGRLTITACQTSPTDATATLTVFSLRNKAIRDIRHGMKLKRKAGKWTVTADAHQRRCYEGHGSQVFSSEKCR